MTTDKTKQEMTPDELAEKYFPAVEGLTDNNVYVKIRHALAEEFLSDLRSVIRGELIRYLEWYFELPLSEEQDVTDEMLVDKYLRDN
jgi:hypothetical protein